MRVATPLAKQAPDEVDGDEHVDNGEGEAEAARAEQVLLPGVDHGELERLPDPDRGDDEEGGVGEDEQDLHAAVEEVEVAQGRDVAIDKGPVCIEKDEQNRLNNRKGVNGVQKSLIAPLGFLLGQVALHGELVHIVEDGVGLEAHQDGEVEHVDVRDAEEDVVEEPAIRVGAVAQAHVVEVDEDLEQDQKGEDAELLPLEESHAVLADAARNLVRHAQQEQDHVKRSVEVVNLYQIAVKVLNLVHPARLRPHQRYLLAVRLLKPFSEKFTQNILRS